MAIYGFQKLTLLDFPGRTASTVFLGGCNFRCPFCQNAALVLHPETERPIPEEEVLAYLKKRSGILDGVCVTGGEPTLSKDLPGFLRKIKGLGYAIKLDTNGTAPAMVKALAEEGLIDMVAMDIKSGPSGYAAVSGLRGAMPDGIRETAAFLMEGTLPHEFRTTVVRELHTEDDFREIGQWLSGPSPYFLQLFRDGDSLICPGQYTAPTTEEMKRFLAIVREYMPGAALRGVD